MSDSTDSPNPLYQVIKIVAKDAEDLHIISTLLQDSIVTNKTFKHDAESGHFSFLANRFCWELAHKSTPTDEYERVFSMVVFDQVTSVEFEKIDPTAFEKHHNLLAIKFEKNIIICHFSDNGTIRVHCKDLHVRLRDVSDPWPTDHKPTHQIEEPA
jgi:hypothetical protein